MATVGNFQWLVQYARAHMSGNESQRIDRFQLWIDGVGGFLVCRSPQIRIGQAVPGTNLELPLVADVSRHHATISRDAEGYVLNPHRTVQIGAREIAEPTAIADGDQISINAVKFKFRRPHPLSTTARLDFVSRHQTQPSASSVLLMSDTCILGPQPIAHVVCRNWPADAVIFERRGELYIRAGIKSQARNNTGKATRLIPGNQVRGDYFSITIEEI